MQQLELVAARAAGEQAVEACLAKAEESGFDSEGAGRHIVAQLRRHGEMSGEALVKSANEHGYRGRDNRCFGGVFKRLIATNQIRCLRSDLPRALGHGTSGGRL
jgi:hypothetical protein